MAFPFALAGLGLQGASLLGGMFGSNKKKTNPYGTLNPEQEQLVKALGPRLTSMANSGPQLYGGQMTEDITKQELEAIDRFNRLGSLSESSLSQLINLDDPTFNDNFAREIADPSYKQFREQVQPMLEESLPSFSTARGNVVARELGYLSDDLLSQRFQARESMKDRSLRAIAEAQNLGVTSMGINAVPREIKQAGLDRQYTNFLNANQQYSNDLQSMLGFLGISTVSQDQGSSLNNILSGIGGFGGILGQYGSSQEFNKMLLQILNSQQYNPNASPAFGGGQSDYVPPSGTV